MDFERETFQKISALSIEIRNRALHQNKTVALAESCTGGLLASVLTDLPRSSAYFWGSVVSYSSLCKQNLLRVRSQTLKRHGATSFPVSQEMVEGLFVLSGANLCVSVTGLLGPTYPNTKVDEQGKGQVWTSILYDKILVQKLFFATGTREFLKILFCLKILLFMKNVLSPSPLSSYRN